MSASTIEQNTIAARLAMKNIDRTEDQGQKVVGPRELYGLLRRRFLLIGTIVVLGTAAALAASFLVPKTYTARSTILLEPDDPNLLEDVTAAQPPQPGKAAMDTKTDLITSRAFMGRVVETLGLVSDPRFNTYLAVPGDREGETVTWDRFARSGLGRVLLGPPDEGGRLPPPEVQRDRAISSLLSRLSVTRSGDSMAMSVIASSGDPQLAATIANAVTRLFVEWARDQKRQGTREAVEFLRQQSRELASNIARTEREITDWSRDNNISSDPRDDLLRAAMAQANEQLSAARGDLTQAQTRLAQVREQAAGRASASDDPLLASPFLTSLRNDEAIAARERAELARNFGANHPLIQGADAKVASVKTLIAQEMGRILANLENDVRVANGRVEQLTRELGASDRSLRGRSEAEIKLRELNRDLLTEQKLYDRVSDRLGKLDPYANVADPGARVISVAEIPVEPYSPKPRILVAGGFSGSLILGFIVATIVESLNTRVHSGRRASQLLRVPTLATIPELPRRFLRRRPDAVEHLAARPRSAFAESFKPLRSACRRWNSGSREQVVMVTSSLPREGKTATATGLAVAAASEGLHTVLVDLHPGPRRAGEAWTIAETTASADLQPRRLYGVRPQHGIPNLDIAAVSVHDGERTGVPDGKRTSDLLRELRQDYDMVVVDAPPLLVGEDAASLAELVDAVILVVGWDRVTEDALSEAGDRLRLADAPLIGLVLARADPRVRGDSSYRASRTYRRDFRAYGSH